MINANTDRSIKNALKDSTLNIMNVRAAMNILKDQLIEIVPCPLAKIALNVELVNDRILNPSKKGACYFIAGIRYKLEI
eukprot:m.28482 g.28482  ORF g.28482 m.28482 type:complete len:79 (+) comp8003_c0_seq3:130-366(+)